MAREQRRLAAIVAADVVGYSRLMGRDESGTLARLREHRKLRLEPVLARHGGRLVKLTGDGALVEFASAVDALGAAIEFQQAMAEANCDQPQDNAIVFRIGLHLGDLIVDGDDLYGDGVNVAARLEAEAPPGGIVVSRAIREAVEGRLKAKLHAMGELALKNIERPIRAFRVEWDATDWKMIGVDTPKPAIPAEPTTSTLALPDKPSIAVLPFQNMSGDPEQDYFADGMVEDIITALSRFKSLFVIARNSSFTFKDKMVDIKQVRKALGVRYVLEGSVRKAGSRVRITGQLIDSESGAHLWADRFDGSLEDIFDLQDRVTTSVVGAIVPKLDQAEIDRAKRKPFESLDAYDCTLRGLALRHKFSKEANEQMLNLYNRAMELDPEFSPPYGYAARCYSNMKFYGWGFDQSRREVEIRRLAERVSVVGQDDAIALSFVGFALVWACYEFDAGADFAHKATAVNPNLAIAWMYRGAISMFRGEHGSAIEHLSRASWISPIGVDFYLVQGYFALSYLFTGRYDKSVECAMEPCLHLPVWLVGFLAAAAAHGLAGNLEEAHKSVAQLRRLSPTMRLSNFGNIFTLRRSEDLLKLVKGLRLAGLPE